MGSTGIALAPQCLQGLIEDVAFEVWIPTDRCDEVLRRRARLLRYNLRGGHFCGSFQAASRVSKQKLAALFITYSLLVLANQVKDIIVYTRLYVIQVLVRDSKQLVLLRPHGQD